MWSERAISYRPSVYRFVQYRIDPILNKPVQVFISVDKQYGDIRSQFNRPLEKLAQFAVFDVAEASCLALHIHEGWFKPGQHIIVTT